MKIAALSDYDRGLVAFCYRMWCFIVFQCFIDLFQFNGVKRCGKRVWKKVKNFSG